MSTINGFRRSRRLGLGAAIALAVGALAAPGSASAVTVIVTSGLDEAAVEADNGTCTLREAISATNGNASVDTCVHDGATGPDTIQFAAALPSISLTIASTNENANANGDLDVNAGTGGLTIAGGLGQTVNAAGIDRVMDANNTGTGLLKLQNLTLTGGVTSSGGAGLNVLAGPVELEGSSVNTNTSTGTVGGGIAYNAASGSLTLDDTEVRSNVLNNTITLGAGISTGSGGTASIVIENGSVIELNQTLGSTNGTGGGVQATNITVSDSTIAGNTATGAGGGINLNGAGTLTVTNSSISDNVAQRGIPASTSGGGGIRATTGTVTVDDSAITGNTVGTLISAPGGGIDVSQAGALTVTDSRIEENDSSSAGGGISVRSGPLTVRRSVVSDNDVTDLAADGARGGGIFDGQPTGADAVEDSLIAGNTVTASDSGQVSEGGGLMLAGTSIAVDRTTIADNTLVSGFQSGGGVSIGSGTANFTNATISGNQASASGGLGGGLFATAGAVNLSNATFSGNDAGSQGDGIFKSSGAAVLRSTIVADGCNSAVTDIGGGSIQAPAATGACGLPTVTPGFIGGLQDNGGPAIGPASEPSFLPTQAIGFAGAAFDRIAGDCLDHDGDVLGDDGRQVPRPFDAVPPAPAGCDSGAFELVTCAGVTVDGPDAITGTAAGETIVGTAGADQVYAASGDDVVQAGGGGDTVCGAEGDDDLQGEADSDRLSGGPGADAIDGGLNTVLGDTADYLETPTGITASLTTGTASGEGADTFAGIENLQGSRLDDTLTGGPGANLINAGTASSADDDVLAGGAGNGPDGDDSLFGGSDPGSVDTVTYSGRADALTIGLAAAQGGDTAGPETDTLNSIENAVGGSGADLIIGTTDANALTGGPGGDTVNADLGADQLFVRDGEADTVGCGPDNPGDVDSVETDKPGLDTLAACDEDFDLISFSPPDAPVLVSVDPSGPANANSPRVKGTADADTTIELFANPSCTGTPAATGTDAEFAGAGIAATVPDNSTTTFRAIATGPGGDSVCSPTSVTYAEVTPPLAGPGPPAAAPPPKRCKKGQKLKKGKCVKKRRKKRSSG